MNTLENTPDNPVQNNTPSAPVAPALPKTPRIPRKSKPTPRIQVSDETLLDDVTRAAKDAVRCESTLADAVRDCCAADLDRDDVIAAVVEGGYSHERARKVVCEVYCAAGKRIRARGAVPGKKTPPLAIEIAQFALGRNADWNVVEKMCRAAMRYAHQQAETLASN